MEGRFYSDETRAKISKARIGTHQSDSTKAKKSAFMIELLKDPVEKEKRVHRGPDHPGWKGGISKVYCEKWTPEFRNRIRAFFEYRCLLCGKHQDENLSRTGKLALLSCHHVYYNKSACCDGTIKMFAPVCTSHHMKTNFDTDRWMYMIDYIINEIYNGKSYFTREEYESINQPNQ